MTSLTKTDLQFVVRRIPKDIRELMMDIPLTIAGGFIRETIAGNEVKDIDLFGPSKDILQSAATVLTAKREARKFKTDNAVTVLSPPRLPVQFITRWVFDDPIALIASLDFTVCQAAVWFDRTEQQWQSKISEGFYPDLAARRLVYTSPAREEEPGGSMLRVRKFLQRGYNIQAPALAAVVARLVGKVNLDRVPGGSREEGMAFVLTGLLYEVDPLTVVDGLEPINEHEVL